MVGGGGGVLEFHRDSYQWKKSQLLIYLERQRIKLKKVPSRERVPKAEVLSHRRRHKGCRIKNLTPLSRWLSRGFIEFETLYCDAVRK